MSPSIDKLSSVFARYLKITPEELNSSFRPAHPEEILHISQIRLDSNHKADIDEDVSYLHWRYFSRNSEQPDLWVLLHNQQVIAAVGAERLHINSEEGPISAVRLADIIVAEKYKNLGVGGWMMLKLQSQFPSIIVIGSNENSKSISDRMFKSLPILKTYKLLFHSNSYLAKSIKNPTLLSLLSWVSDALIRQHRYLRTLAIRFDLIKGTKFQSFDKIDDFLLLLPSKEIHQKHFFNSLNRVERNIEFLIWRFQNNPRNHFKTIAMFDRQNILLGYVLYTVKEMTYNDNLPYSLKEGFIVDWNVIGRADPEKVFTALFLKAASELDKHKVDRVNLLATDEVSTKSATNAGFILRDLDSRFYVYQMGEGGIFYHSEKWAISYADDDVIDLIEYPQN